MGTESESQLGDENQLAGLGGRHVRRAGGHLRIIAVLEENDPKLVKLALRHGQLVEVVLEIVTKDI